MGLSDRANATMEICAFVSSDRIFQSLNTIACLKKSRRSLSVGTSGLIADRITTQFCTASFNHLISPRKYDRRHCEPKNLRSFDIDHQLKFCGLFNG